VNHGFDALRYLDAIPAHRVVQVHLAGHRDCGHYIVDTHDGPVADPVWRLYRHALRRIGPVSTLLEWDARIPSLEDLHAEVLKARGWLARDDGGADRMPQGIATDDIGDTPGAYPALAGAGFQP
jgi:uncharacterized protein (UPF0276 family)